MLNFGSMKYLLYIFVGLIALHACSRMEDFAVANPTAADCRITYELQPDLKGFGIFNEKPLCYELTRNGKINWDIKVQIDDDNPDKYAVDVTIPAKTILIIGNLSNDTYTVYNQEFINDRKFNLQKLTVACGDFVQQLTPATFDSHFTKVKGVIQLTVK